MLEISQIIINLEERLDKLINCIKELRKININENIIISKACDKDTAKKLMYENISKSAYKNIVNKYDKISLNDYESVGRAISHKTVWNYIVENKINYCFIIEDNLKVKNEKLFKFDFSEIKRFINSKGDVPIYITFNAKQLSNRGCFFEGNLEKLREMFYGSNFYFINFKMARFLLYKINKFEYHYDYQIGDLIKNSSNKMNFYNYNTNSIGKNIKLKSDIKKTKITLDFLIKIFNLSNDLIYIIYSYVPIVCKLNRYEYLLYFHNNKFKFDNFSIIPHENQIEDLWH